MRTSTAKVAIVSDTHGEIDERIAAIVDACDYVVHAGDIGNTAVLERLAQNNGTLVAVRGNNDITEKWSAGEHDALHKLAHVAELDLPGGRLVVVHGDRLKSVGRHSKLRKQFPQARAIVYGHSHRMICDRASHPWVLNPGAAGRRATFGGPSCLVLNANARHWKVEEHRFFLAARKPPHPGSGQSGEQA